MSCWVPSRIIVIHIGNSCQLPKNIRDLVYHEDWFSGIVVWCNLFNLSLYNTSESYFYLLFFYFFLRFGNYFWSLKSSLSSLSGKTIQKSKCIKCVGNLMTHFKIWRNRNQKTKRVVFLKVHSFEFNFCFSYTSCLMKSKVLETVKLITSHSISKAPVLPMKLLE